MKRKKKKKKKERKGIQENTIQNYIHLHICIQTKSLSGYRCSPQMTNDKMTFYNQVWFLPKQKPSLNVLLEGIFIWLFDLPLMIFIFSTTKKQSSVQRCSFVLLVFCCFGLCSLSMCTHSRFFKIEIFILLPIFFSLSLCF